MVYGKIKRSKFAQVFITTPSGLKVSLSTLFFIICLFTCAPKADSFVETMYIMLDALVSRGHTVNRFVALDESSYGKQKK